MEAVKQEIEVLEARAAITGRFLNHPVTVLQRGAEEGEGDGGPTAAVAIDEEGEFPGAEAAASATGGPTAGEDYGFPPP